MIHDNIVGILHLEGFEWCSMAILVRLQLKCRRKKIFVDGRRMTGDPRSIVMTI